MLCNLHFNKNSLIENKRKNRKIILEPQSIRAEKILKGHFIS